MSYISHYQWGSRCFCISDHAVLLPGIKAIYQGPYYSFMEIPTFSQLINVFDMIQEAWDYDGPFDGLLGFSLGGGIIASYLLQDRAVRKPFKCAVFFCCSTPFDPQSSPWKIMDDGRFIDACTGEQISSEEMTQAIPELLSFNRKKIPGLADMPLLRRYSADGLDGCSQIDLPTVHIYASNDIFHGTARGTMQLCRSWDREVVIHRGGHSVPCDEETTSKIVRCIHDMTHAVELA